jgi:hypothetical protein
MHKPTMTKKPKEASFSKGGNDQFISRRALCLRWDKSAMSIKRMEKAGILKSYRIGRDARYRMSDILALEASWEVAMR